METQVNLKLVQDDQPPHRVTLILEVKSNMRPRIWSTAEIDPDALDLSYRVEHAAEDLAVHQCQSFGDIHNPPAVAKSAMVALERILSQAAAAARAGRGRG